MLAVIRGAGDLASGIALRLYHSGFDVVMTDLAAPMAIRRTVAFSEAVVHGVTTVEDITARRVKTVQEAKAAVRVYAMLAARNLGTRITDAPVVIGVGPGVTAKVDCHAVVETMRGHTLGRAIYEGSALPNTNIPGLIGGFAGERVLRAPADGVFEGCRKIGEMVRSGDVAGYVAGEPMRCTIDGVLRGLIATGAEVKCGMKCGDVDPRGKIEYCYTVSDKALAVGGGVLEAALHLTGILKLK